jgi:hypothetical protein
MADSPGRQPDEDGPVIEIEIADFTPLVAQISETSRAMFAAAEVANARLAETVAAANLAANSIPPVRFVPRQVVKSEPAAAIARAEAPGAVDAPVSHAVATPESAPPSREPATVDPTTANSDTPIPQEASASERPAASLKAPSSPSPAQGQPAKQEAADTESLNADNRKLWVALSPEEQAQLCALAHRSDCHDPERDLTPHQVYQMLDHRARDIAGAANQIATKATEVKLLEKALPALRPSSAGQPPAAATAPDRIVHARLDHAGKVAKVQQRFHGAGKPKYTKFYSSLGEPVIRSSEFHAWKRADRKHCGTQKWNRLDAAADGLP